MTHGSLRVQGLLSSERPLRLRCSTPDASSAVRHQRTGDREARGTGRRGQRGAEGGGHINVLIHDKESPAAQLCNQNAE